MSFSAVMSPLPGVVVFSPDIFSDHRGFFLESYNLDKYKPFLSENAEFVQDNHSRSAGGVLRGLHYQINQPQGKLVRAVEGAIFDVAVDIRKGSPNFGGWFGVELSAENKKQLWVPPDFAHGFLVLTNHAQVLYKATDYYAPEYERGIRWDDPDIGINWPGMISAPLLSQKDKQAPFFRDAELPSFIP